MQFNVVSQHGRGLEQNEVGVRREYPIRFQASKISRDKESIIDKETQISGSDIKTWTELNWTEEVVNAVQVNQVTLCLTLFIWPLTSYICCMTWSKKWILNSHIWVQAENTFQCVNKVYLQKTAFSLVKSRLALGSSGWSFGCLFGCHHAKNGPIWLKNGCWLPPSDHIHS